MIELSITGLPTWLHAVGNALELGLNIVVALMFAASVVGIVILRWMR